MSAAALTFVDDELDVAFDARDPKRAFGYVFLALFAFLFVIVGWPLTVLAVWASVCAGTNHVRLTIGRDRTSMVYGPTPWLFRRTRRLGRAAHVGVRQHAVKNRYGGVAYTIDYLIVTDVDGETAEMRLGAPGTRSDDSLTRDQVARVGAALRARSARGVRDALSSSSYPGRADPPPAPPRAAPPPPSPVGLCPRDRAALDDAKGPLAERACARCRGAFVEPAGFAVVLERLALSVDDVRTIAAQFAGRALACAGCGARTQAVKLRSANIDVCFSCGGAWLDDGEVNAFHAVLDGPR